MRTVVILMLILAMGICAQTSGADDDGGDRSVLGQITDAPKYTMMRTSSTGTWKIARTGYYLKDDYEVKNTEDYDYEVEMYGECTITFPDGAGTITSGNISGSAEYKDADGDTHQLPSNTTVTATGVMATNGSTVPVTIAGQRCHWKPKGWGGRSAD